MKFLLMAVLVAVSVTAAIAQSYNATSHLPTGAPSPAVQPTNAPAIPPPGVIATPQQTGQQPQTGVAQAVPSSNNPAQPPQQQLQQAPGTSEAPALTVFIQGTVASDDQKRQVTQRLQEIPGVLVITNRIHVLGEINEAAGASRTNRSNARRVSTQRRPF